MIENMQVHVGYYGENTSSEGPLLPNLKKLHAELPVASKALRTENEILRDFIYNKELGKNNAYRDLTSSEYHVNQELIDIANDDGTTDEYVGVSYSETMPVVEKNGINPYLTFALKTSNPGVIGQVLVSPTTGEMKVLFRGTSDNATTAADLEVGGPGAESFSEDANAILAQVNALAGQYGTKKMVITGHSLGGALAQQFKQRMIEAQAQNHGLKETGKHTIPIGSRNHLSNIKEIDTFVYNSAGISKETADRAKTTLKYLKSQNPNLKIGMHYCLVGGDLVQLTGEASILSDVSSDLANVSMVKLQNGCEGLGLPLSAASSIAGAKAGAALGGLMGPISAVVAGVTGGVVGAALGAIPVAKATHCNSYFTKQQDKELGFVLATNETVAGRELIHKTAGKKSKILNHAHTQSLQKQLVSSIRSLKNYFTKPQNIEDNVKPQSSLFFKWATTATMSKPIEAAQKPRSSWWPFK